MEDLEESEAETSPQLFHVFRFSPNYGMLDCSRPSRVRNEMEDMEESEAETSFQLFHVFRFSPNYGMLDCFALY